MTILEYYIRLIDSKKFSECRKIDSLIYNNDVIWDDDVSKLDSNIEEYSVDDIDKICICDKTNSEDIQETSGIVIDENKAKVSPCVNIKDTSLTFSKGIIGALSPEQKLSFCESTSVIDRPKVKERQLRFRESAKECSEKYSDLKSADKVKSYIDCMKESLHK